MKKSLLIIYFFIAVYFGVLTVNLPMQTGPGDYSWLGLDLYQIIVSLPIGLFIFDFTMGPVPYNLKYEYRVFFYSLWVLIGYIQNFLFFPWLIKKIKAKFKKN